MNNSKKERVSPVGAYLPIGITFTMIIGFFNFIYVTITLFPPIGALILIIFALGMQQLYVLHKKGESTYLYLLIGLMVNFFICFMTISCMFFLKLENNIINNSWIIDSSLLIAFIEGIFIGQKNFHLIKSNIRLTTVMYIATSLVILLFLNRFGMVLISIFLQYKTIFYDSYFFNVICLMVILIVDFMMLGFFITTSPPGSLGT